MAATSNKLKVLRAAVLQNGRVLEELRLSVNKNLSVGRHPKSTFVVAEPELPAKHDLFVYKKGQYYLVFTEAMRGRISAGAGSEPVDLSVLKENGQAIKSGNLYRLPITEAHRGKVILGTSTLVFQFVAQPKMVHQAKLPVAARGTIWQSIDWPFALALALAVLVEVPTLISFQYMDPPDEISLDSLDDRWASILVPERKAKDIVKKKPKPKKVDPNKSARSNKVEKVPEKPKEADPEAGKKRSARSKAIRKGLEKKGILAILGTLGAGGATGAVADVFAEGGGVNTDLDSAFEGISGVGIAQAGGPRSSRGGGAGKAAGIGGLATGGGGKVGLGGKAERRAGSVKAAAPEVDGELDSAAIAKVVRGRMRMIRDCYEKELKRSPGLSGKIEIEFTIGENGRIEDVYVSGNSMGSDAVGNCIVGRIRRWRFPKPDGGSVTVNYPFIFTSSN